MELKPAKRKKCTAPSNYSLFPANKGNAIAGIFTGSCCCVTSREAMTRLFDSGFYGKGTLSRSEPNFNHVDDDLPEILLEQQWMNRKRKPTGQDCVPESRVQDNLAEESVSRFMQQVRGRESAGSWKELKSDAGTRQTRSVAASCDLRPAWSDNHRKDDSEQRSELSSMVDAILESGKLRGTVASCDDAQVVVVGGPDGPRLESARLGPREVLQLSLQETFFLAGAVGALTVTDRKQAKMSVERMWCEFQAAETNFVHRYVVYHWYRSRGWVVRSGLKYGGDLLLYEKGPSFCHSSYLVRIHDGKAQLAWNPFARLQRLVETFKKDIILCTVVPPADLREEDLRCAGVVSRFRVREVMVRRWIPSQQRVPRQ